MTAQTVLNSDLFEVVSFDRTAHVLAAIQEATAQPIDLSDDAEVRISAAFFDMTSARAVQHVAAPRRERVARSVAAIRQTVSLSEAYWTGNDMQIAELEREEARAAKWTTTVRDSDSSGIVQRVMGWTRSNTVVAAAIALTVLVYALA